MIPLWLENNVVCRVVFCLPKELVVDFTDTILGNREASGLIE